MSEYPRIRVSGPPRSRGLAYGNQAAERIRRSIAGYQQAFQHYAGWDWARVRREAARFEAPIAELYPDYVEEMRGIAEGAGAELADILAINVRTEVMSRPGPGRARTSARG